jgi:hypothetical protein
MKLTARQRELTARHLLANPDQIPVYLKQKKWRDLEALVEFSTKDAPLSLAHTDPALFASLRQQITDFHLRGWSRLNLEKLRELAKSESHD